jgi:hypothetical protein
MTSCVLIFAPLKPAPTNPNAIAINIVNWLDFPSHANAARNKNIRSNPNPDTVDNAKYPATPIPKKAGAQRIQNSCSFEDEPAS